MVGRTTTLLRFFLIGIHLGPIWSVNLVPTADSALRSGSFGGIVPESYELTLRLPLRRQSHTGSDSLSFEGQLRFTFQSVEEQLDTVYLHSKRIRLRNSSVATLDDQPIASVQFDVGNDLVVFKLAKKIDRSKSHQLVLKSFQGRINGAFGMGLYTGAVVGWPKQEAIISQFQMEETRCHNSQRSLLYLHSARLR